MFYACAVAHVAYDVMRESLLQSIGTLEVEVELLLGEIIETIVVATHEMREHRTRDESILMFEIINEARHIVDRVETQTVHTGIEFDVYRHTCDALLACSMTQGIKQTEGIDLRLEVVVEHSLEGCHLRIHNHDVGSDASLTQCHALIGNRHSKIVNTMVLQSLGYLYRSGTIAVSLYHADEFRFRFHVLTIPVEV